MDFCFFKAVSLQTGVELKIFQLGRDLWVCRDLNSSQKHDVEQRTPKCLYIQYLLRWLKRLSKEVDGKLHSTASTNNSPDIYSKNVGAGPAFIGDHVYSITQNNDG